MNNGVTRNAFTLIKHNEKQKKSIANRLLSNWFHFFVRNNKWTELQTKTETDTEIETEKRLKLKNARISHGIGNESWLNE